MTRYGVTSAVRHTLLASLLLPAVAMAAPTLDLQYSTFYSQMKTFAKGEFGHARLGFYLTDPQNGQLCGLVSAQVSTQDKQVAAEVTVDSELRLPFDNDLNLDKGTVVVTLKEPHASCDLAVQVMADVPVGPALPLDELAARQQQMQLLLEKMAGMVGKHFLPKMAGVRIALVEPSGTAYLNDGTRQEALPWQHGQLLLSNEQLTGFAAGQLIVQGEVLRLTPWLHKG
ncbi:DUF2987 domain-containing protein [Aeromonas sobria]|uniref:DUF2987 domain-containing protein n=1 Tax=Aeromonas sobria TaxID=646 RepID=UPI001117B08B|nr:DUF2987 domain-containing protein [Aeromonas sobria]TNH90895.1 hypothetical protein CF137_21435 [Aeromonas sobria]HEH9431630.1 DUF2987 domain-containing protein [Aeromonas sobria]